MIPNPSIEAQRLPPIEGVLWEYCGEAVGTAKRSAATPGSSDSVFDDLRCIRSGGGFGRAKRSDLGGALALPDYVNLSMELAFDQARSDLATFVSEYLDDVAEIRSNNSAHLDSVAAVSLRKLLLNDGARIGKFIDIRSDAGRASSREWEAVRDAEDDLLRRIARAFVQERMPRPDSPQRPQSLDVTTSVASTLGELRAYLANVREAYLGLVVLLHLLGFRTRYLLVSGTVDRCCEVLYWLTRYRSSSHKAAELLGPKWVHRLDVEEERMWPAVEDIKVTRLGRITFRALDSLPDLLEGARAVKDARYLGDFQANDSCVQCAWGMARIVQSQWSGVERGTTSADECLWVPALAACHTLELLLHIIEQGGDPEEPLPYTVRVP